MGIFTLKIINYLKKPKMCSFSDFIIVKKWLIGHILKISYSQIGKLWLIFTIFVQNMFVELFFTFF